MTAQQNRRQAPTGYLHMVVVVVAAVGVVVVVAAVVVVTAVGVVVVVSAVGVVLGVAAAGVVVVVVVVTAVGVVEVVVVTAVGVVVVVSAVGVVLVVVILGLSWLFVLLPFSRHNVCCNTAIFSSNADFMLETRSKVLLVLANLFNSVESTDAICMMSEPAPPFLRVVVFTGFNFKRSAGDVCI